MVRVLVGVIGWVQLWGLKLVFQAVEVLEGLEANTPAGGHTRLSITVWSQRIASHITIAEGPRLPCATAGATHEPTGSDGGEGSQPAHHTHAHRASLIQCVGAPGEAVVATGEAVVAAATRHGAGVVAEPTGPARRIRRWRPAADCRSRLFCG